MNRGQRLRVPTAGQVTGIEETEAVEAVMLSKQYASYRITEQFEHEFAAYVGKKYGVFVNSGSSANLLAVTTLNELQGVKRFITPACAFPTTINPLILTRREVELVDVDAETYQPGDEANYGAMTLGNYHPYPLIEDSCDAMYPGKYTGLAQTFSFFPAHHMTTGEGGMITTDDADFYRVAKSYRDWGRDCWCLPGNDNTCGARFAKAIDGVRYDHKYIYSRIGYNLKATEMQAAIGLAQLKKLPEFTATRVRNFKRMLELLKGMEYFFHMPKSVLDDTPWFGFPLTIKNGAFSREHIVEYLDNQGIGTRPIFGGNIRRQPAYKGVKFHGKKEQPNSDKIYRAGFYVGTWHGLTLEQIEYTAEHIKDFVYRILMP
jgi:CDP-4-dehydro-6-deoxyglucose reductase, E1